MQQNIANFARIGLSHSSQELGMMPAEQNKEHALPTLTGVMDWYIFIKLYNGLVSSHLCCCNCILTWEKIIIQPLIQRACVTVNKAPEYLRKAFILKLLLCVHIVSAMFWTILKTVFRSFRQQDSSVNANYSTKSIWSIVIDIMYALHSTFFSNRIYSIQKHLFTS